jgi:uncharacterized protein (DUF58 family)
LLFHDVETDKDFFVDPLSVKSNYLRRFEEHSDVVRSICQKLGAEFIPVSTDRSLARVLSDFLRQRQRRGKSIRRRDNL